MRERCLHLPYSSVLFQSLFGFETRTRTTRADVCQTFWQPVARNVLFFEYVSLDI
jgi:hypothetical protein